jgi:hypothetical protein
MNWIYPEQDFFPCTSLDQIILIHKILFTFFTRQATLIGPSPSVSTPCLIYHLGESIPPFCWRNTFYPLEFYLLTLGCFGFV